MPLLDIATAQPSLQNHLPPLRPQHLFRAKLLFSQFTFGDDNRFSSACKLFKFPTKLNFNAGHLKTQRGNLLIKSVATFESKSLVQKEDGDKGFKYSQLDVDATNPTIHVESSIQDSLELDEREQLRRMRISKANKGNTPWNKGRKHSAETRQRIRERTRLAMQNPKVKMKLANLGHAQSKETRMKIGVGVRMGWQRRRQMLKVQETCYFEWQNLIAEASRRGLAGEEELQWDSYKILSEQLEQEWVESVEQRRIMSRPKGSKRAPKSPEQRRKIAEAIAAKWADPEYRDRVCSGLAKYHGIPVGVERKPRRRPSGVIQSRKRDPTKKKASGSKDSCMSETENQLERSRLRRSNTPVYKDPLVSSKLEMIKNIRAKRAAAETKKTEAIERARLLIAEAEKAAKALEAAAIKSPIARASLMETRKLIAEAIQSIESIETGQIMFNENGRYPCVTSTEQDSQVEKELDAENGDLNEAGHKEVNGTQTLASSKDEDFNFANFTLQDILNGEQELLPTRSSGFGLSSLDLEGLIKHSGSGSVSAKQLGQLEPNGNINCEKKFQLNGVKVEFMKDESPSKTVSSTKKWVSGRLVDVSEGD